MNIRNVTRSELATVHLSLVINCRTAPDLTKLDSLFGLLSAESASFDEQLCEAEKEIKSRGIADVFQALMLKDETATATEAKRD